ncbi:shikimate kinase [Rothia sp. LK2588]|uniref:shikimate kinase n=1 Tax=Rothia sp. LK2588 TaxID=3114369 RepID=UPI0034CD3134
MKPAQEEVSFPDPQRVREVQEGFLERRRPIVLIGPMAAGKSYIGAHIARFYGYRFLDADHLFVEKFGPISEFIELYGEPEFRAKEALLIAEVLNSPRYRNCIFSLGGGAPMTDAVAEILRHETVIYILVDLETVRPRIENNTTRPLLQPNPVEKWVQIMHERQSRYEELATYTLDARGNPGVVKMTSELQEFILSTRKGA